MATELEVFLFQAGESVMRISFQYQTTLIFGGIGDKKWREGNVSVSLRKAVFELYSEAKSLFPLMQ